MRYISFLQSSTAVFLAALPAPPLLKITGRVSQGSDWSLIGNFKLISVSNMVAEQILYVLNMLVDHL